MSAYGILVLQRPQLAGCCRKMVGQALFRDCAVAGGQYDCGTTDVTRTFHLGEPTKHQRVCFTRVLQVLLHARPPHSSYCAASGPLLSAASS